SSFFVSVTASPGVIESTLNGPNPIGFSLTSGEDDISATSISPKICLASGYVQILPVTKEGVTSLYVTFIVLSSTTSIPSIGSASSILKPSLSLNCSLYSSTPSMLVKSEP